MALIGIKVRPHDVAGIVSKLTNATYTAEKNILGKETVCDVFTLDELKTIGRMLIVYAECYDETGE